MDSQEIREFITHHRLKLRLTQAEVGARAKVTRELVSRYENDSQDIGLQRLIRICNALGLELVVRPGSGRPAFEDIDELFKDDS
jgi:transcriptional regulator with XRE-family HTH domain